MSDKKNTPIETEIPQQMRVVALPSIPRTSTREGLDRLERKFDLHAEVDARDLGVLKAKVDDVSKKTDKQTLIISLVVALVGAAATIAAALISH